MTSLDRRHFLGGALAASGALTSSLLLPSAEAQKPVEEPAPSQDAHAVVATPAHGSAGDFAFSPVQRQTAFCFPDDPYKSLVDQDGTLLYGYDREKDIFFFPLRIDFALYGMREARVVSQVLESPSIPIVHTTLEREDATMTLTTFATNNEGEGRVDNVLIEVRPRKGESVAVSPLVRIRGAERYELHAEDGVLRVADGKSGKPLLLAKVFGSASVATMRGTIFDIDTPSAQQLTFHPGAATTAAPYRAFVRIPQAGQAAAQLTAGLGDPDQQLRAVRSFWNSWSAFHDPVSWQVPGRSGDFVAACARNILQARELKQGKLTFQVGPTCYRGLWVVDGNFILEAARYLGYDREAVEGLRTTWGHQQKNGQIVAAGGLEHYKDTAIAMFTLVRQCELAQDWSLLHELEPNVIEALTFIDGLRARAKQEGSALGQYGLLPKGFADGGFDGSRDEFTNTLWTMAGLKAIGVAGEQQKMPRVARASQIYRELHTAFTPAAANEMRSYEGRFQYLPMLLKDDPAWNLPDPWDRPRPQCAHWALSHTIFPGRVFEPGDPVVKGHVELMKAVTQEGIPAETGWNHHEAVWSYNAPFVAEVYLWLGMQQAAHDTFEGFLNHASPQYCWREEQPLQHAMVGSYVGDMPHNWASAECIRYMRHILALEDGGDLRLLAGMTAADLAAGSPYVLKGSPTRFGRLNLNLEPLDRRGGWRLNFEREAGPVPASVSVPATLAGKLSLVSSKGLTTKQNGSVVNLDPALRQWSLTWKS